jgi:hypothetical protein
LPEKPITLVGNASTGEFCLRYAPRTGGVHDPWTSQAAVVALAVSQADQVGDEVVVRDTEDGAGLVLLANR